MGLLDSMLKRLGYSKSTTSPAVPARRGYTAAKVDRLTADWIFSPVAADQEIRQGMQAVRSRARDLAINDSYIRGYLRACRKNIVGPDGFGLQVRAINADGKPDNYANRLIEGMFAEWSKRGTCEISGRFSFRKVQALVVSAVKRDGEFFIRKVRGRNLNKFGFSLQLIEPDAVDETYNMILPNGNIIRMGIEHNIWRRPVAYYFKKRKPEIELYGAGAFVTGEYERVPASDVIHAYDPERADQTRDVSQMAPVMTRVRHLVGYEEAAVVNARASACKMGFFRDPNKLDAPWQGDSADALGPIATAEPGTFEDIGGREFQAYDPKYPGEQHGPFVKTSLHGIATGLGISYSSLSQDLSEVNFSSIRAGLVEEREEWKEQQAWFAETVLDDVFADWLDMALLMGALGTLPAAKFDKFNKPVWIGRRWAWVDPGKDIDAQMAEVRAGFKAPSQVVAEKGGDLEEVYRQMKADKELAEEYELELDFGGKSDGGKEPQEPADDAGGEPPSDGKPNGGNGKGNGKLDGEDGRGRLLF